MLKSVSISISSSGGGVSSVTGTANRITSTGGTTPAIDIAATYVGQSSITTVGTLIGLNVTASSNDVGLFKNAATFNTNFNIDTTSAAKQSTLVFLQAGAGKWVFGNDTDNTFFLYDIAGGATAFRVTTGASASILFAGAVTATSYAGRLLTRSNTVASSATPAINTDTTDIFTITALAVAITSMTTSLTGTPTNGQKLTIRFLDNGTARAISWGASFASRGATLPTTTVLSKYLYVGLIWNSTTSTWDCVATAQEA